MTIHETIKAKRKELGLTQEKIANQVGINKGHYSKIENGIVKDFEKIIAICKVLGIESINIK